MRKVCWLFTISLFFTFPNNEAHLNEQPFTPGINDGLLFSIDSDSVDAFYVDGVDYKIQLLHCETDDECACSTSACSGGSKDFLVSSMETTGGEKVIATSTKWDKFDVSCPQGTQKPKIIEAKCLSDTTVTLSLPNIEVVGPLIEDIEITESCEHIQLEFFCENALMERRTIGGRRTDSHLTPHHRRAKGAKGNTVSKSTRSPPTPSPTQSPTRDDGARGENNVPYTPDGMFLFCVNNGSDDREHFFVDGFDYKFEHIMVEDNGQGRCSSVACMGQEMCFGMKGMPITGGEMVVLSATDFSEVKMYCPRGNQIATLEDSKCDDGTTAANVGIDSDSSGPYLEIEDDNCSSGNKFITVTAKCANPAM